MKIVYGLLAMALITVACSKDKFETKPKITIKSFAPDVVPIGGTLTISLEFTDKEGDVDDSVTVIRTRLNGRDFTKTPFPIRYKIPTFPDKSKGQIDINLPWATSLTLQSPPLRIPGQNINEPDTLSFKFFVKDAKGNSSDTATMSGNVVVIR